jgi:hypothetical protein
LKRLLLILLLMVASAPLSLQAKEDPALRASGQGIGDEELEPKDPFIATTLSVLPGVLLHGTGSFYAGDYEWGSKMLVTELVGTGIALWGYSLVHEPEGWNPYFGGADNTRQAGYWIKFGGVVMLAASWIGDVSNASAAAEDWNRDHALQFQLDSYNGTGARLALASNF